MTPALAVGFACAFGAEGIATAFVSTAAFMSGIHFMNGDKSFTSWMYQTLRVPSQRAPKALTASFSAKGVTKLIRMPDYRVVATAE